MDQIKEPMEKLLETLINSQKSPVLTDEKYDAIVELLKNQIKSGMASKEKHSKHWVQKNKTFRSWTCQD